MSAFVERFAADLVEAGMQRMPSRVFACLLVSEDGALSSAELGARLRISPAAVSGAVRYLAQVHLISRERQPGSRRERYRVHADAWYEAMTQRDAVLGRWVNTFQLGVDALGPQTRAGRRVAETAEFFTFMQDELAGIMRRWRERHPGSDSAAQAAGTAGTAGTAGAGSTGAGTPGTGAAGDGQPQR
ncbi:MarR family transcriptional regulator [Streptomyces sp. 549]|uniref:GbsR/MarR family transcriptional regulator n=1 Tax=Streptomyces sp. 549 TaxID=3049076 RepID=UPI0024C2E6AF|nr:MarR family transcriptional regulator [Streptomyces sp. 549]MDK1473059.1 MarR family transcriptional regulator [Streptomyces sp. 549]